MRRTLACWALFLGGVTAVAATRSADDAKPVGRPLGRDQAEAFALKVKTAIDLLTKQYARPVQRARLVAAALRGLYRAARVTAPHHLAASVQKADEADYKVIDLIARVRQRLGNGAALRGDRALEVALTAALRSLDPYCVLSRDDPALRNRERVREDRVGVKLDNVGVGPLRVTEVVPGSPGQRAGIRPGDLITHLDGNDLERKTRAESKALWERMNYGSKFRVTLVRPRVKGRRILTLRPRTFPAETVFGVNRKDDNTWNFLIDKKERIAHVRLGPLQLGTAAELARVLTRLKGAGVRGIVLDLRWCPGGLLTEGVDVASLFVGDRTVATIDYRDGRKEKCVRKAVDIYGRPRNNLRFLNTPLVVLVNGETQGGGELIAAAVQDARRGAVVGQRTVGKGSIQNFLSSGADQFGRGSYYFPLPRLAVRLSVGVFTRSSGKNLQRFAASKPGDDWGVRPDAGKEIAISRGLSQRYRDLWIRQSLRPGSSKEALPLDDPEYDVQRQFALKVLRKIIKKSASRE
jgi:C-terminal peptidase prc